MLGTAFVTTFFIVFAYEMIFRRNKRAKKGSIFSLNLVAIIAGILWAFFDEK